MWNTTSKVVWSDACLQFQYSGQCVDAISWKFRVIPTDILGLNYPCPKSILNVSPKLKKILVPPRYWITILFFKSYLFPLSFSYEKNPFSLSGESRLQRGRAPSPLVERKERKERKELWVNWGDDRGLVHWLPKNEQFAPEKWWLKKRFLSFLLGFNLFSGFGVGRELGSCCEKTPCVSFCWRKGLILEACLKSTLPPILMVHSGKWDV